MWEAIGWDTNILTSSFLSLIRYAIVWEKGYQETDVVTSAALTKVKGVEFVPPINDTVHIPGVTDRIWDVDWLRCTTSG